MTTPALVPVSGQLVFTNLYRRVFIAGLFEWLWRSLAYVRWQLLVRRRGGLPVVTQEHVPLAA